jgi:hypothetical protein
MVNVPKQKETALIRRGGAPSVAAAHILIGGMGVSTPILLSEKDPVFRGNQ